MQFDSNFSGLVFTKRETNCVANSSNLATSPLSLFLI
jgi:hypothetical protein